MFTFRHFPSVTTSKHTVYSAVDIERLVAVELVSGRGQSGGFVWVINLNGAQIPFETAEYLNDDPFQSRVVPHFTQFGSLSSGGRRLGDLRHKFADAAEMRAAQMLAVEGVLVRSSRSFRVQELALHSGQDFEEIDKLYPSSPAPQFNFEERTYTLEDFGYENGEVGTR